jgi:hypothetical protein
MYNGTFWIEILNMSTGANYSQEYYAQFAWTSNKANNTSVERNYTTTNTCYPMFATSNAQGASTGTCVANNLTYLPSTGVLSLSARPQVNGVDVALSTDTPDIPTNIVESEDYSQSSDVSNALTNYVTKNELLNLTHPINSIYISINSTSPSQLFGGTTAQIEYAAEMGLEHHLGLTCDPVCGLVQIPCIERNAFAAARALDANTFSNFSDGKHRVSFDQVVEVMRQTGNDLPSLYKETSEGGLAKHMEQS